MQPKNVNDQIMPIMQMLELPMSTVQPLLDQLKRNAQEAQPYLTKFKMIVRKQRRHLAKKYHPDITKDGGEHMKKINNLIDVLLASKIIVNRPQVVVYRYYTYGAPSYNDTTTVTGTGYYY